MANIDTITKRKKLAVRREPYWHKLGKCRYIGFRKSAASHGTWIARKQMGLKKVYESLGSVIDLEFEDGVKLANQWFDRIGQLEVLNLKNITVKGVIEKYIRHLKVHKTSDAAYRTEKQLEKHLIPELGAVQINRLTTGQFKNWFISMVRLSDDLEDVRKSKDSANRVLSMAKAAFNLAFKDGLVSSDTAWRRVTAFKKVGANRELYITKEQVSALLDAANIDLRQIVKAGIYTGARLGELISAQVKNFDAKNGILEITKGKTGSRTIFLQNNAVEFFKETSTNKLPNAYIFTTSGERWNAQKIQRPFKEAVRKAKLPGETVFYSLRHYHISKALTAGLSVQTVARNCGTSTRMIEQHYAKFLGREVRAMFNKVAL